MGSLLKQSLTHAAPDNSQSAEVAPRHLVVSALLVIAMAAPSPALAPGVWALVSPAAMLGLSGVMLVRSSAGAGKSRRTQQLVITHLFFGLILAVSSIWDGGPTGSERFLARLISVAAVYSIAMYASRLPQMRRPLAHAVVAGATLSAAIAVAASLLELQPLGAELLRSRDFLIPVDLPKTTGVPRSFGEAGIVYGAGLAFAHFISSSRLRILSQAVLVAGFLVGQSRNMLAVMVAILLVQLVARLKPAPVVAGAIATAALLSPFLISVLLAESSVADPFVGEGIFARNVASRLSLLEQIDSFQEVDSVVGLFGTTHSRWAEVNSNAPHNHFVSLIVIDGLLGVAFLMAVYVRAVLYSFVVPVIKSPEFAWFVGCLVGLSFYEGAYSAAVTIALGLFWPTLGRQEAPA